MPSKIISIGSRFLVMGALFLGIGLRIWEYYCNRSLYLDEANLVRNVAERSFEGFFQALDYHQYAPPVFLSLLKLNTLLLGQGEYGLRLWPLLAGLIALVIFWKLIKTWNLHLFAQVFSLALFSLSGLAILYGTSAKQYSSDMMVTVLLILIAYNDLNKQNNYQWRHWIIIGVLSPWLSMSSVFILSGIGLAFWWRSLRQTPLGWTRATTFWSFTILAWIASFGLYYWLLLRSDIESDFLQQWHQDHFLPLLPLTAESLQRFSQITLQIFKSAFGFTGVAILTGITLFLLGTYRLIRHRALACLLLFPLFSCWVASALQQYSMMPRLLSFAFPIIWFIAAWGIQYLYEIGGRMAVWVALPFILLSISIQGGWRSFKSPIQEEQTREALDVLAAQWEEGDGLFLFRWSEPAFEYYSLHHPEKERYQFSPYYHNPTSKGYEPEEANQRLGKVKRTWLLYTHVKENAEKGPMLTDINQIEPTNNVSIILSLPGTYLYLIRPNE